MLSRFQVHASEGGQRLKHGWFRDGVTHPFSDFPPDGLARINWEGKASPVLIAADPYTWGAAQMVGAVLVGMGVVPAYLITSYMGMSANTAKQEAISMRDAEESK